MQKKEKEKKGTYARKKIYIHTYSSIDSVYGCFVILAYQ